MTTNADTIDLASARPAVQFNPEGTHPFEDAKKPVAETDTFPGHLEMPLTKTNSSTKSNSRRNSLAAFAERLRSRSSSRSRSQNRHSLDASSGSNRDSFDESLENDPARKTSDSQFDYAAIIKAQHEFMERLRAEQLQKNIHTNVDGIPIPAHGRRRSSLTQILGMDKPLLAR
ncbi:hypothetical protein BG005_011449 [Podila minutissima]|nr:hypothetical protein BG005_011449 [Podila minutissima]